MFGRPVSRGNNHGCMPIQQLTFALVAVLQADVIAVVYATKAGRPVVWASHSSAGLIVWLQANTTAVVYATKAVNHVEGGWPKEVDYTEAEHVIRYRKKVRPLLAQAAPAGCNLPLMATRQRASLSATGEGP